MDDGFYTIFSIIHIMFGWIVKKKELFGSHEQKSSVGLINYQKGENESVYLDIYLAYFADTQRFRRRLLVSRIYLVWVRQQKKDASMSTLNSTWKYLCVDSSELPFSQLSVWYWNVFFDLHCPNFTSAEWIWRHATFH